MRLENNVAVITGGASGMGHGNEIPRGRCTCCDC